MWQSGARDEVQKGASLLVEQRAHGCTPLPLSQTGGGLAVSGGSVTLTHSSVSGCNVPGSSESVCCTEGVAAMVWWLGRCVLMLACR